MVEAGLGNGAMRQRPAGRRLVRILFAIAAVALLVALFGRVGLSSILDAFARLGWRGALLLFVLGMIENLGDSLALRSALRAKAPALALLGVNSLGALVNVAVPWEAGEVVKGTMLSRMTSAQDAVSATLTWNYMGKSSRPLVASLAALVGLALGCGPVERSSALLVLLACVLSFLPYLGFRILIHFGAVVAAVRALRSLPFVRQKIEKLTALAGGVDRDLKGFWRERRGDFFRLYAAQLSARLASYGCFVVLLRLLGLAFPLGLSSLLYAAVSVAGYFALIVPARLGVTEGAGYLVFSLLGLDGGLGFIVQVIQRVKMLITNSFAVICSSRTLMRIK